MSLAYTRAATAAEAVAALAGDDDARFLAGGQTLLPAMRLGLVTPSKLVDLQALAELREIRSDGQHIDIGAMVRHEQVAAHREVQGLIPGLAGLAAQIGDRQVRRMGSLGGSIANADPAACYPAALLGLGATVHTDRRAIAADDFFLGPFMTALEPGELIQRVRFPVPRHSHYEKFRQPASRFALVGVFVSRGALGVRVAVTGAAGCAFRATALETALMAHWSPEAARSVRLSPEGLNDDLHASAAYRAALIPELTARAVQVAGMGG